MKNKLCLIFISAFLMFVSVSFSVGNVLAAGGVSVPPTPAANVPDYGLGSTANAAGIKTGSSIQAVIGKTVGYLLSLVGILFFLLALYAGFLWMTARGQRGQVEKAQGILIDAVTGLVVVSASYIITQFIFNAVK